MKKTNYKKALNNSIENNEKNNTDKINKDIYKSFNLKYSSNELKFVWKKFHLKMK